MNYIYDALLELCKRSEAFFARDYTLDGHKYRIFDYRLAQYSDWLNQFALDARGIMFEIDQEDHPIRIAARPMEKFFNYNENPLVMGLDVSLNNIHYATVKMDGSLISTYIHKGDIRLKSKGSIASDQAYAALRFLDRPENAELKQELYELAITDYTVDMEYVAPTNRIVIGYPDERLVGLSIRDNYTGQYWSPIKNGPIPFPALTKIWVETYTVDETFLDTIYNQKDTEGCVMVLKTGQRLKFKTEWYSTLHKTKDSLTIPRHLFEAVINGTSDDLRAMFSFDEGAIKQIDEMEKKVIPIYDHIIATVEAFYQENKHLSRKDYAILGQSIKDGLFGLKMNKYLNKPDEYKQFCIAHNELFDIQPDPIKSDGKIVTFE